MVIMFYLKIFKIIETLSSAKCKHNGYCLPMVNMSVAGHKTYVDNSTLDVSVK